MRQKRALNSNVSTHEMKIETFRKKARNNSLEVEHILAAAKARLPGLRAELQHLSEELDWSTSRYLPDGTHVVPFGKWAQISGAYAEGGISALASLAESRENSSYIIAMLEEVASSEAVDTLLNFFSHVILNPENDIELSHQLSQAFNQLLSIKGSLSPSEEQASKIRDFLSLLFISAKSDIQRTFVLYAFRGVGDRTIMNFLSALHGLTPQQESARKEAIRHIRKLVSA